MSRQRAALAVIVLYRMRAEESPAYRSLHRLLQSTPEFRNRVELQIADNSPEWQEAPAGFAGRYERYSENPGLARCYNDAIRRAEREGYGWVLLLDQDTTVTGEYLEEALTALNDFAVQTDIVAFVPRLMEGGSSCSPMQPPRYGPARRLDAGFTGRYDGRLHAFNSGAVVRVSAMVAAGGFPMEFPLDYLDHATFAELQGRGGRVYVLRAVLQHELSSNREERKDLAFRQRQESILEAERRFYARYGSAGDRLRRRIRLLRACVGRVLRGKDGSQTWRMLKWAIRS
jgi:GT2 family glycosyltransferase